MTLLVVSQLEDIAEIASFGAKRRDVVFFTLYQVPYILPLAIPLSCLISANLLFHRLSEQGELTSLRACGFSFVSLLSPLFFITVFLSLANFGIISEIATRSHLATRKMVFELTSQNPLVLLQNMKLTPFKKAHIQFLPEQNGKVASNLLIAWGNQEEERIQLAIAKKVKVKNKELIANDVSLISSQISEANPYLLIENQSEIKTESLSCAKLLYGGGWKMATDHLRFSLLKVRIKKLKKELLQETQNKPLIKKTINRCYIEMVRRFSFGFAPISLFFFGAAFGIRMGRVLQKKQAIITAVIAALCLFLFFVGKLFALFFVSVMFLSVPHLILFTTGIIRLKRISKGII